MGKLPAIGIILDDSKSDDDKLARILCPTSTLMTKLVNKYFDILFKARKSLDEGSSLEELGQRNTIPPTVVLDCSQSDESLDSEFDMSYSFLLVELEL